MNCNQAYNMTIDVSLHGRLISLCLQRIAESGEKKWKKISDNTDFSFEQILLVKDFKSGKQPLNSGAIRRKLGNTTH